jgi:hypothetical protein
VDLDSAAGAGRPAGGGDRPPVDIDALTEKVYRLLLGDVRLEVARAGLGPRKG